MRGGREMIYLRTARAVFSLRHSNEKGGRFYSRLIVIIER